MPVKIKISEKNVAVSRALKLVHTIRVRMVANIAMQIIVRRVSSDLVINMM